MVQNSGLAPNRVTDCNHVAGALIIQDKCKLAPDVVQEAAGSVVLVQRHDELRVRTAAECVPMLAD